MIVVTGATGHLGRLIVEGLLSKLPAAEIAVAVRNPEKAKDLAARGVQVRKADYEQPESLVAAFKGADKLMFVSGSEVGKRIAQHRAVVDAAKKAGVKLIVYTSILRADTSKMALAAEHKATEEMIRASGIPFVLLRNGWYLENYTANLAPALQYGALMGSAKDGKIAAATRADYAAAAVAVLTGSGHENKIYELGGDEPFTMSELAAIVAKAAGKPVAYNDMPEAQYKAALVGVGLPEGFAGVLADSDVGISRGELNDTTGQLGKLIGRRTTSPAAAVKNALAK